MEAKEIRRKLGLADSLPANRTNAAALRQLCPGGPELLDAKEWAQGIAGRSRDPMARKTAGEALQRIRNIERALLAAMEREYELPAGSLTDHI